MTIAILSIMRFAQSLFENSRQQHRFPYRFDGTFRWLASQVGHEYNIGADLRRKLPKQWENILKESKRNGVLIPKPFADFIARPDLYSKIRSISGCYLDLSRRFTPFGNGNLLRFLNDSQGCAFWYLYISGKADDHCVLISYDYFDEDTEEILIPHPRHFVYDSPSFESWLCRYWLENEIVIAHDEGTEMPPVPQKYIREYTIDAYIDDV